MIKALMCASTLIVSLWRSCKTVCWWVGAALLKAALVTRWRVCLHICIFMPPCRWQLCEEICFGIDDVFICPILTTDVSAALWGKLFTFGTNSGIGYYLLVRVTNTPFRSFVEIRQKCQLVALWLIFPSLLSSDELMWGQKWKLSP